MWLSKRRQYQKYLELSSNFFKLLFLNQKNICLKTVLWGITEVVWASTALGSDFYLWGVWGQTIHLNRKMYSHYYTFINTTKCCSKLILPRLGKLSIGHECFSNPTFVLLWLTCGSPEIHSSCLESLLTPQPIEDFFRHGLINMFGSIMWTYSSKRWRN